MAASLSSSVLNIPSGISLIEPAATTINNTTDFTIAAAANGIAIRDAHLILTVGSLNRSVIAVRNSIPTYSPVSQEASVSAVDATRTALDALGAGAVVSSDPALVYVRNDSHRMLDLCYDIRTKDSNGMSWRITVNATTGAVTERRQLAHFFGGDEAATPLAQTAVVQGKVHLKIPTDTLTLVTLPFVMVANGADTIVADSAGRFSVPAKGSNLIASLRSPYTAVVNNVAGSKSASLSANLPLAATNLLFNNTNSDVAELDAYHTVNGARSYIHRIDTALHRIDQFLLVNVNFNSACNAFYDPPTVSLTFFSAGNGCVNTAEIADVVQHEFGHRTQHAIYATVFGQDSDIVNSSLGEGFADVYSAFMRDEPQIGIGFQGTGTELRNCDNTLKWPTDLSIDPHANGSIVAGAFWDLRKLIGLDTATHLFQQALWHTPDAPDVFSDQALQEAFVNTLLATLIADDNDNNLTNGTPHTKQILTAFAKHNITLSSLISLDVPQLPDQDTGSFPYPISIGATYSGPVGSIDTNSLTLYYSIDKGKTYSHIACAPHQSSFISLIPPQPAGSVVLYYVAAKLNISNDSIVAPTIPYSFLVGYKTLVSDPCETNTGWSTSLPNDAASTGLWELAKPVGTYQYPSTPPFFIQQDTDHSPNGVMCYVTGNKNAQQTDIRNPSTDDVDGGATTLTTPNFQFDTLRNPVFRYWYYYSNDQGSNPGSASWVVKVSFDSGAHWRTVVNSPTSTDGWTQVALRLSDYGKPTRQVQFQFVASDYLGSLVEAGIDDIELLDVIPPTSGVPNTIGEKALAVFPNPVVSGAVLHVNDEASVLTLTDVTGRLITSGRGIRLRIPDTTPSGAYLLRVETPDGHSALRSVIVTK
ncbi:MAG: hypothetical protein JSS75_06460 [Bacteroidetes bacterium]|nr:hypothetical protein [Bacteroidota bacterium]